MQLEQCISSKFIIFTSIFNKLLQKWDIGGGWWEGKNSDGNNGLFPSSYVEIIESTNSANTGQSFRSPEYSADDIQVLSRQENESAQDWEDSWDEDAGSGNQEKKKKERDKSKNKSITG
ncbi:sorting nexin-9 [Caerostris extrusa]|uniref:Sorting nexin-9 n=1 Tax=Caerostris extrusa TaxID=172846 RepID=A0AAV4QU85_CAEEX|nr:sorting nexin-9 [Caerostris extrusa]